MSSATSATASSDPFIELSQLASQPTEMIEALVRVYRRQRMPHELFESLKMRMRLRLGLPILGGDPAIRHDDAVERELEAGLLEACREVGAMLIRSGRIREGWMYLRPTGDVAGAAELLRQVEVNDDNMDDVIQVALNEGVDIELGYGLLLSKMGTCNSITSFEQTLANRHYRDQRIAAKLLLNHLYDELLNSIRVDIQRREGIAPTEASVAAILESRPGLLDGSIYHLDTTHLSSTVRLARVLEDQESIQKCWELVQYGRKLNSQFQYPGDEPFVDFYPAYGLFYGALLGRGVDQAVSYFEKKARDVVANEHGTGAIEVYVDLLDRLGRPGDALRAAVQLIPAEIPATRVAPLLLELAEKAGDVSPVAEFARRRGDLLLFAAAHSTKSK